MIFSAAVRLLLILTLFAGAGIPATQQPRVISLLADRNSTFRLQGTNSSELDLLAGEPIVLRVEARKAKSMNRDGSVHDLVLLDSHRQPVPGWELSFKPGVQEIQLNATTEAGVYEAVCSVICSV